MKAFPKTIYAKIEAGGSGPDYLLPCESLVEAAEMGERIKVGVYTLTETVEVKGVAITNTIKASAKPKKAKR